MGHPTVAPAAEHLWQVTPGSDTPFLPPSLRPCRSRMHPSGSGMGEIPNDSLDDQAVRTPLGRALQIASSFCRLGMLKERFAAFEHARGIGALSPCRCHHCQLPSECPQQRQREGLREVRRHMFLTVLSPVQACSACPTRHCTAAARCCHACTDPSSASPAALCVMAL